MKVLKSHKNFEGEVRFWEHNSVATGTPMKFSTFTPKGEVKGALIWLSGLTCTDENFITKAGAQKYLSEQGLMLICPDTSPRGLTLPGEHDSYDFGSGAGFYVNATTAGYKNHYRMYDYIANEIYGILKVEFKIGNAISIFGHSMGGHGALVIGLRETGKFRSISAFSPIANPVQSAWGQKALTGYLGENRETWSNYDATELIKRGQSHPGTLLIDQGSQDEFLAKQLLPENLVAACKVSGQSCELHLREGYDHSYYFIASFVQSHIEFHARAIALG
ncbi:MAG: S-formylglutathione hydrolase [Bdellovibrionaceae bacterium]|nr:S-formylglutathione hydrolase [Pseudobdellovibrionaceae bacterium]